MTPDDWGDQVPPDDDHYDFDWQELAYLTQDVGDPWEQREAQERFLEFYVMRLKAEKKAVRA